MGFESMTGDSTDADANMLQDTGDIPVPASASQVPGAAPLEFTTVRATAAPVSQVPAPVTLTLKFFSKNHN